MARASEYGGREAGSEYTKCVQRVPEKRVATTRLRVRDGGWGGKAEDDGSIEDAGKMHDFRQKCSNLYVQGPGPLVL